ncbi:MAG: cytochrome ubiquinol oxidase subunit I, partial [Pseudomonadota bacterium]
GTTMSAFWIIVLNSWMHTPAGFEMRDGVAHATDWWAIIFNASMPYRFVHMMLASVLTCAFLIAGLSALRYLWGAREAAMPGLKTGVFVAAIAIPLQIFAGDMHGLNTLEHQPAKVAAMEGNYETRTHVPLALFGIPNDEEGRLDYAVEIPSMASFILTHSFDGEVPGLNDFEHTPPTAPVFFAFRIMVGIGFMMLAVSWAAAWFLRRARTRGEEVNRWPLYALVAMTPAGWVATLAGWYVTEIGRQPWLVSGVLSTADAAGPVGSLAIAGSLIAYLLVYAGLLAAYIGVILYLVRKSTGRGMGAEDRQVNVFVPAE